MINKPDHNSFMCSFAIETLFTNVPLEEIIKMVIKNVFGRKKKINGLNKSDYQDLLKLKTVSTVFYFNGNYYKQLDGVAMGHFLDQRWPMLFYIIKKQNGKNRVFSSICSNFL